MNNLLLEDTLVQGIFTFNMIDENNYTFYVLDNNLIGDGNIVKVKKGNQDSTYDILEDIVVLENINSVSIDDFYNITKNLYKIILHKVVSRGLSTIEGSTI